MNSFSSHSDFIYKNSNNSNIFFVNLTATTSDYLSQYLSVIYIFKHTRKELKRENQLEKRDDNHSFKNLSDSYIAHLNIF